MMAWQYCLFLFLGKAKAYFIIPRNPNGFIPFIGALLVAGSYFFWLEGLLVYPLQRFT
jgi:hypothetical protein